MSRKANMKCIVCGNEYRYCLSCSASRKEPLWKNIYHDENCKNIYEACSEYGEGLMSLECAIEILNKCDLSNRKTLHQSIKDILDKIFPINNEVKNESPLVEPKIVSTETVTIAEPMIHTANNHSSKTKTNKGKNNKKK